MREIQILSQIIVYGTRWCGDCKRALKILDGRQIRYEWINIDKNTQGEAFVMKTNNGFRSVPTIIFPDGSIMVEPKNDELNEKLDSMQN